jgi:hypothetical protein
MSQLRAARAAAETTALREAEAAVGEAVLQERQRVTKWVYLGYITGTRTLSCPSPLLETTTLDLKRSTCPKR